MAIFVSYRSIDYVPAYDSVTITLTTDIPCHVYFRFTDRPPRIHLKSGIRRGFPLIEDLRFCFTVFQDLEQDEAGDTYTHTFLIIDWYYCQTKYFYFWAKVGTWTVVSTSAPLKYHHPYVPPPPTPASFKLAGTANDCRVMNSAYGWDVNVNFGTNPWGRPIPSQYQLGCGLRFTNVTIPQGSVIASASLRGRAYQTQTSYIPECRIQVHECDTSWQFSDEIDWWARNWSSLYYSWTISDPWQAGWWYDTPDIAGLVQLIVDRPGWSSGNSMSFTINDFANLCNAARWFYSYNLHPASSPLLQVEYWAP